MEAFEYNASPARVIFGNGTCFNISYELARQHLSASLLLSTPRQAELTSQLKEILKEKTAGVFTGAKMHTPIHVTEEALEYAKSINADSIISIGGGSTIGLGKAISFRTGLPHIAIPTTYAGSEMTPILGETRDGKKTTRKDPEILPGTVIYDVDLTLTLPEGISATSGINAIAHASNNYLSSDRLLVLTDIVSKSRGPLRPERKPYNLPSCGGRYKCTCEITTGNPRNALGCSSSGDGIVRSLAMWNLSRICRDVSSSQTMPYPRWIF